MIGDIMTVSRMRMGTDGDGVSTLVSFFGCPLRCKYCINNFCHDDPDSYDTAPRAIYTPEELIEVLKKDAIYYEMSGGGVVFGGGEPLLQSAFIHEVCQLCEPGWKKRIETSLNVSWVYVEPLLEDIDEWVIDVKSMNWITYKKYTGVKVHNVRDNLLRMEKVISKDKFHIRIPRIPGFTDDKDIERSVEDIKRILDVEPEIFDYIKTVNIETYDWEDEEEDEEDPDK